MISFELIFSIIYVTSTTAILTPLNGATTWKPPTPTMSCSLSNNLQTKSEKLTSNASVLNIKVCFSNDSSLFQHLDKIDLAKFQPKIFIRNDILVENITRKSNRITNGNMNFINIANIGLKCFPDNNVSYRIEESSGGPNNNGKKHTLFVDTDGSIVTPEEVISPEGYCISNFTVNFLTVVACVSDDSTHRLKEDDVYNASVFGIYCVVTIFLFVIVFCYGLTVGKQKTQGWIILAFSTSNFIRYFFWTVSLGVWQFEPIQMNGLRKVLIGNSFCVTHIAVVHYFDMATLTWMTILNFEMFYTIRSMALRWNKSKGKSRFLIFLCIGFGIPLIILMISLIREYEFMHFQERKNRQQYASDPCGLEKYYGTWHVRLLYGVVLFFKSIFIFSLIKLLIDHHRRRNKLHGDQRQLRNQTFLYGKLFILMDVTWIFEIIWASSYFGDSSPSFQFWYRFIKDGVYILQALFLFWLFVCKKDMKDMILNYPIFNGIFQFVTGTQERLNLQVNLLELSGITSDTGRAGHVYSKDSTNNIITRVSTTTLSGFTVANSVEPYC